MASSKCLIEVRRRIKGNTVDSYIKDAQDSNRSDLVELWRTIKQDRHKHANMLREALEKEVHNTSIYFSLLYW